MGLPAAIGSSWTVARMRDWQNPEKLEQLAVNAVLGALPRHPRRGIDRLQFAPLIAWATRITRGRLLLILDQFEEYFLYRDPDRALRVETAVGELVARRNLPLHLLVAIRDDALHHLDEVRAFIPGILETTIKLDHLSDAGIEEAVKGPVRKYNEVFGTNIRIEDSLVPTLIGQLKETEIGLGARRITAEERHIVLPYLQLALTKIWEAEGGPAATALRTDTLVSNTRLGGVRRIVSDYVKDVMGTLAPREQQLCARIFDRLVTDVGSKIAYPVAGLATREIAGPGVTQETVEAVLRKLTPKRLLKPVITGGLPGYEIFHDALGFPILEWKRDYQRRQEARKNQLVRLAAVGVLAVGMLLAFFALWQSYETSKREAAALGRESWVAFQEGFCDRALRMVVAGLPPNKGALSWLTAFRSSDLDERMSFYANAPSCHFKLGLPGHKDAVYTATYNPDGSRILTASADGTA